jgi:thiol-disulfide isomerase/thioredoxin
MRARRPGRVAWAGEGAGRRPGRLPHMAATILVLLGASVALAQQAVPEPSTEEQQSLMRALSEGGDSPVDLIRALEAHLRAYPDTVQRGEVELRLAQAAIDAKDTARIVRYGEPALEKSPNNVPLLDRVTAALLTLGGKENADRAYKYARALEDALDRAPREPGRNASRRQDDRERALGQVLLYETRARTITGENEEAERLAARSFSAYPCEESAREWAQALQRLGRQQEAVTHLAEAFTIPDAHATDSQRLDDRLRLGELYSKLHGSEKGLGDAILAAYDRTSTVVETRKKKLLALEPNSGLSDPFEFTLTGLDGKKLQLSSFKGKLLILDFWATWCEPCRAQHPMFQVLKDRFRARPEVVFLDINADDDRSVVEPFLRDQMWDRNIYFDDGLTRVLKVEMIPTTILFDGGGKLASRMDGFDPSTFVETMAQRIQSILAQMAN